MFKNSYLLSLVILCSFSCNSNPIAKTRNITRDEAFNIVNNYPSDIKEIKKIDVSWDNKTSDPTIQTTLKNMGAGDEYQGNRTITDTSEISLVRQNAQVKYNLHKNSFETFFNHDYAFNLINETKIQAINNSQYANYSYTYIDKGYVEKLYIKLDYSSIPSNPINYVIEETFYY